MKGYITAEAAAEHMIQSPVNDTQEETMRGYVSAKEVAAMIGVDPSAIRKRAARGSIPGAKKVGEGFRGDWWIPESEATQLIRSASGKKPPKKG